jgi:hypothetical protein
MLADGGSAVDATLAAAITLTLVEPVSNGIGSDAFAIVWDGRQLHGLNASGRSPAAWTPNTSMAAPCGGPDQPAGSCRFSPAETAGRHRSSDAIAAASKQECFSAVRVVVDGRRGVVDLRIAW